MNDQFTTTFVPKKPMTAAVPSVSKKVSRPVGLLATVSTLLFLITLGIGIGIYFWKQFQVNKIADLETSVSRIEKAFEPDLITKLQSLDKQLKNGTILLQNHTVISPIFAVLESSTLPSVRFTRFEMSTDDAKGATVKMAGEADGYPAIAQQSDVLSRNTFIRDMIFSNFVLTQRGKVSFDVSFGVRPEFVNFQKAPLGTSSTSVTTPSSL